MENSMEGKHYAGISIMNAVELAASEYGCGVDDLDYEVVNEDEDKEIFDPEKTAEIVVYGVFESSQENKDSSAEGTDNSPLPKKEASTLTEEEFDHIADVTTETIREILKYFGAEDSEIDEYEGDEGEIILDVVGEDLGYLIGRHGKTLDAFQFMVTSITNKKLGFRVPVTVDIEGYKNRRKEKIETIARNAAKKAMRQGYEARLKPMTPYERRIVHMVLKDDKRVETFSEGTDPNRYVVVRPL